MSFEKKSNLKVTVEEHRDEHNGSPTGTQSILTARSPRNARFAEATTVISPVEGKRNPFMGSPIETNRKPSPERGDAPYSSGFSNNNIKHTSVQMPMTPFTPVTARTPGALKVPGTPGRYLDPRSPTFKEELALEKEEANAEKQNANDLKVKTRIRISKFFLRGVNFGCSLIVLSMLSTTFVIFNATKALPPRNNLPPWAAGQQTWPQITLLVMSCVSLAICCCIFYGYWKGGHRKAAKTATYYTMFAVGFFIFSTVMWVIGAVVLHQSRANGNGQDMWGWSCNMNKRETLFNDTVNYALICRLQNWSLICALIEVTIEVITIAIYAIVFYRVRSKRKLMKNMDTRDKARNDLYLAQLKLQSAPNTPGFNAQRTGKSIRSAVAPTFGAISEEHDVEANIDASDLEYQRRYEATFGQRGGLAPPAINITGATPQMDQGEFDNGPRETQQEHFAGAAGEQTYAAVPIPGAYNDAKPQH